MKHPIFNHSNLAKHLWLDKHDIKFFTVCMPVCVVTLKDGTRIKVKADDLIPVMESDRQERSKEIEIQDTSAYWYKAYNPKNRNLYRLDPEQNTVECTCDDYQNITRMLGEGKMLCKHGYALLNYLGCNSLKTTEYQETVQELYEVAQYEAICDRNEMMSYAWQDDSRYWG